MADYCLDLLETASSCPNRLACQPGCDFCCYNQVELTAPEALLLGSFLPPDFLRTPSGCAGTGGRVPGSAGRQTKEQLAALRAEFPCPLLADGRCSVYEVRPLMCRAMHSLDVATCRQELPSPASRACHSTLTAHIIHVS